MEVMGLQRAGQARPGLRTGFGSPPAYDGKRGQQGSGGRRGLIYGLVALLWLRQAAWIGGALREGGAAGGTAVVQEGVSLAACSGSFMLSAQPLSALPPGDSFLDPPTPTPTPPPNNPPPSSQLVGQSVCLSGVTPPRAWPARGF